MSNERERANSTPAVEENVQTIETWERASLLTRSAAEQISDWIARKAASGVVLLLHVAWFSFWLCANTGLIPGIRPFDPFPFPFLTFTVSLEAIFLALFVLASQNRMSLQSDKRSHLDLQIDLRAEREMTAVLRLLQDIAGHLKVKTSMTPEQLQDLMEKTDVPQLTRRLDELAQPDTDSSTPPSTR